MSFSLFIHCSALLAVTLATPVTSNTCRQAVRHSPSCCSPVKCRTPWRSQYSGGASCAPPFWRRIPLLLFYLVMVSIFKLIDNASHIETTLFTYSSSARLNTPVST